MEVLGVIPARSGSKGIPRKNVVMLCGLPLIAYTFLAAKAARCLTRLIVSTDDARIMQIAREYDVEIPFRRPRYLGQDETPDLPVFQHCLEWLCNREGYSPDIVVHLRPTAPLREPHHIDDAVELLCQSPNHDSVRSVCPAHHHPLKMWRITGEELAPFMPSDTFGIAEPYNEPRQSLPKAFVQNCVVDAIRARVIMQYGSMTGKRIKPFITNEYCSVDIDTEVDLAVAESLLVNRVLAQ